MSTTNTSSNSSYVKSSAEGVKERKRSFSNVLTYDVRGGNAVPGDKRLKTKTTGEMKRQAEKVDILGK